MLRLYCRRARRSEGVPVSPNIRSNVTRGLISTGSGEVSVFHARLLKYTHANPSHAPIDVPISSVPTSSEGSGVSWLMRSAMY